MSKCRSDHGDAFKTRGLKFALDCEAACGQLLATLAEKTGGDERDPFLADNGLPDMAVCFYLADRSYIVCRFAADECARDFGAVSGAFDAGPGLERRLLLAHVVGERGGSPCGRVGR